MVDDGSLPFDASDKPLLQQTVQSFCDCGTAHAIQAAELLLRQTLRTTRLFRIQTGKQFFPDMLPVLRFLPNRVLRLYSGGSGIDRLRSAEQPEDNRYPEDWIASCIEGNGRAYLSPGHGISRILADGEIFPFPEFLQQHAEAILGPAHKARFGIRPGVLTKLLDSAERLPLQVHPTRAQARELFGVDYGKTEAWIILSTREIRGEKPYLLTGFRENFNAELFFRESREGVYEKGLEMLHKLPVRPGDVIVIHGGLPHAIGPGVTMVEVMEPSDLVIVPEKNCCGVLLDEEKRFSGLGPDKALSLFDGSVRSEAELRKRISPPRRHLESRAGGILSCLIPYSAVNGYFEAHHLKLSGKWEFRKRSPQTFRIGIVTRGALSWNDTETFRAGESFLIPFEMDSFRLSGTGEAIFILPPDAEGSYS